MIVELPNGQELEFPDGTSQDVMRNAIAKQFPQYATAGQKQGWQGVWQDVLKGAQETPAALANMAKQLPGEALESGKQIVTHPVRAAENLGAGLLEGLKGVANTPYYASKYLESKGILDNRDADEFLKKHGGFDAATLKRLRDSAYIGDTGLQKAVFGEAQPGDPLLQGIASFAPYAGIGGLEKGLSGALQRAGGAGLYAVGQNQNPVTAMIAAPVAEGAGQAIGYGASKLKPSEFLRGKLSLEELARNLEAAKGTSTPLGRVIANPHLNRGFESMTSHIPLAGGEDILGDIKSQVEDRATNVVKSLEPPGGVKGDLNDVVKSLLTTAFKKQQRIKNDLYTKRNALAEQEGHQLELPNFEQKAKSISGNIEKSPLYQNDPEFMKMYNKMRGYKDTTGETSAVKSNLLDQYGNPIVLKESEKIMPSLTEAQSVANKLYSQGQSLLSSRDAQDRYIGGMYKDLSKSLRDDINQSIEKKGSSELQAAHSEANKNFKENFSPFLEKNTYKLLNEEKDPEKIVREIIKPGAKNDQYKTIQKVNNLLPEDQKNLLGYTYLKSSEDRYGKIDPKELASKIKSLGNRQFEALFPDPEVRQSLLNYANLRGMNEEALNLLHNPKTGARAIPTLHGMALFAHPFATLGTTAGAYLANKIMTSPKIREILVNKMIENAKQGRSTTKTPLSYVSRSYVGSSLKDENQ